MTTAYSTKRGELKTGDIILFSGKGAFSDIIKYGTFSKWSHVGMVLKLPGYEFLTVWESTTLSNIADLDTKKPRKGVQLVALSDRVHQYSGSIAVRQLQGGSLDEGAIDNLMGLREEIKGKEYEKDKLELIKAAYDGPFGKNSEDLSSLFCSELVAEAYQRLGLLDETKPSNEYTPADFSEKRMNSLRGDFTLSEEIILKDD